MVITDEGIQVVVDEKANMQWNAYFKRNVFTDYDIRVETIYLRLPLHDLMVFHLLLFIQFHTRITFRRLLMPYLHKRRWNLGTRKREHLL